MLDPAIYPDPVDKVELVQTQTAFVFLAGPYVYKVKKPVNLGYLDFSTLEKRHYFCNRELVLNRRLCPDVYLGVIPITRNKTKIALAGEGQVIDYAVKMVHLPHERMLDYLLENDRVSVGNDRQRRPQTGRFLRCHGCSPTIGAFGKVDTLSFTMNENFNQTEKYFGTIINAQSISAHQDVYSGIFAAKSRSIRRTRGGGKIRDCHGDLHCQHICFLDGICIIDCIEFNDRFRYIDVAADIAFLAMDLDHFGRADLSRRLIEYLYRTERGSTNPGTAQVLQMLPGLCPRQGRQL